jgi:gliding motility-associated-like protein
VTIRLSHLIVNDPDNVYPDDFKLSIKPGTNYTSSGATVTPAPGFTGALNVNLSVNDGTTSSNNFPFRLEVIDPSALSVVAQKDLEVPEDETLTLSLDDFTVNDPGGKYPSGFTLVVRDGENYATDGLRIIPAHDFDGSLTVNIVVNNGSASSRVFPALVRVTPVNDPPLLMLDDREIVVRIGDGPVLLSARSDVKDPDNESLFFAEIGIDPDFFQSGADLLSLRGYAGDIRSFFDSEKGIMLLVGESTLEDYKNAINAIEYTFSAGDSIEPLKGKRIYFQLNDGDAASELYYRPLQFAETISLDIPTVFTPNNDSANDTWKISSLKGSDYDRQVIVRVFTQRGNIVYESTTLANSWDGRASGQTLPAGSYFYVIEIALPYTKRTYRGIVNLLH